jgi:hypothetical protein
MKVGLWNDLSVCVSPINNFRTACQIFMKFDNKVMPFKETSTQ